MLWWFDDEYDRQLRGLSGHAQHLLWWLLERFFSVSAVEGSLQNEEEGVFYTDVLLVPFLLMCIIAALLNPDISSDSTEAFVWVPTIYQSFLFDPDSNIFFFLVKVSISKFPMMNELCRPSPKKHEDKTFIDCLTFTNIKQLC